MTGAWIGDEPTTLEHAIDVAAGRLAASRLPVISVMNTDVAGARAAVALAGQVGGVIDHVHSGPLLRDLDLMREGGLILTSPGEAYNRCDLLLLVGRGLQAAPLVDRLLSGHARRVLSLCAGDRVGRPGVQTAAFEAADLPGALAVLRARIAGRPIGPTTIPTDHVEEWAALLRAARFGVAVWSAVELDDLTLAMLAGLIKDLNNVTRFCGLPISPGGNGVGVQQVIAWRSGFPVRTGFARGFAEHDPWRFDAMRLIEGGEADCAVWIAADGGSRPPWLQPLPLVALVSESEPFRRDDAIVIEVGRPGIDHPSVGYSDVIGALVTSVPAMRRPAPSASEALAAITAHLPAAGAC